MAAQPCWVTECCWGAESVLAGWHRMLGPPRRRKPRAVRSRPTSVGQLASRRRRVTCLDACILCSDLLRGAVTFQPPTLVPSPTIVPPPTTLTLGTIASLLPLNTCTPCTSVPPPTSLPPPSSTPAGGACPPEAACPGSHCGGARNVDARRDLGIHSKSLLERVLCSNLMLTIGGDACNAVGVTPSAGTRQPIGCFMLPCGTVYASFALS